jgi:2-polyprenyl-3-methyl-5-hydroxy-6-metoxy-1,4-benzoquinol methylase
MDRRGPPRRRRLVTLARRCRQPELMDRPGLDPSAHRQALDSLGRAHWISRSAAVLWSAIRLVVPRSGSPLRILDLGCGGGHVIVDLVGRCAREGVAVEACGIDVSPVAIDYARALAARARVAGLTFAPLDVTLQPLPDSFDVVICSLFLHHLGDAEAEAFLRRMRGAARRMVVVSDLRRTRLGYLFAWVGCRLLSRSRVFHVDGTRSVEAAFTMDEARLLAVRAGLTSARLEARWPQRFLLTWRHDGER